MTFIVLMVGASLGPLAALPAIGESTDYKLVPLMGQPPAWWTTEVRQAALEAGVEGKLYNPLTGETVEPLALGGTNFPFAPDSLFIRPGALFLRGLTSTESLCTYGFVFNASAQISTAGFCVTAVGQPVFILAVGGEMVPLVTSIGTVASFRNGGVGDNWALIDIAPQWQPFVDPNVAYVGGPSCTPWTPGLGVVKHVGHAGPTGFVASVPRLSVVQTGDGLSFSGIGEISFGDGGSPTIFVNGANEPLPAVGCTGGRAVGIMTHCAGVVTCNLPLFWGTDVRNIPATITLGFDPL